MENEEKNGDARCSLPPFCFFSVFIQVNLCSPANNETYQERLLRLEGDKESLVLQVRSVCVCGRTSHQFQIHSQVAFHSHGIKHLMITASFTELSSLQQRSLNSQIILAAT